MQDIKQGYLSTRTKRVCLLVLTDERLNFCCLAVRAEHLFDLVGDELLDVAAPIRQILARVEVRRFFFEMLADARRHGKTQVGVDVNLADRGLCRATQLILGDADGIWHVPAILINDLYILWND